MAFGRVNYLNKDFNSLKKNLITFARENFPNANQDFNDASSAGMLVEMVAYAGDVLSFYIDHAFNEQFIDTAVETTNVQRLARKYGYKPQGPSPSVALCKFYVELPVDPTDSTQPDLTTGFRMRPGSIFTSNSNIDFNLINTIDFTNLVGATLFQGELDSAGNPVTYIVEKEGFCISGAVKTINIAVGGFQQFRELTIPTRDITSIISVFDTSGNQYYEVDELYQDVVFQLVNNTQRTTEQEPNDLLKMIKVDRRFTTEFQLGSRFTKVTFGSGDPNTTDIDAVPNPGRFATPLWGKRTFSSFTIDPRKFTQSATLGIGPADTTLRFRIRFGGGNSHNVAPRTIRKIKKKDIIFPNQDIISPAIRKRVADSLSVTNPNAAIGGTNPPTIDEVRVIAPSYYASQNRLVTQEDFIARVLSLPQTLGSVFRVTAERDRVSRGTTNIRVLSKDSNNKLVTTTQETKENIKTLLTPNRMLTDNIQILDALIVNLGIEVSVLGRAGFNLDLLRENILRSLISYFDINNFFIGQHIVEEEMRSLVFNINGVAAVNEIKFTNIRGTVNGYVYSNTRFDVPPPEQRQGILECPRNAIFEVRFPNIDIKVSVK
jgi:hypothetical protein